MKKDIMELAKDRSSSLQKAIIPIIDQIALIHVSKEYVKESVFNRDEQIDKLLVYLSKQLDEVLGFSDVKAI